MKTIIKTRIYLALVAMFMTLVVVGAAAAENQVPFRGSIQGSEPT
jgi:hypothetical protein